MAPTESKKYVHPRRHSPPVGSPFRLRQVHLTMVRTPCCEKTGLKKGPWTAQEDRTLINYINQNGEGKWRVLPKRAGLLRCGKSCRLRWVNYLRPDIKRGSFTAEEEETIIRLQRELGNSWSTIAARLPGRTDNEIKNVWHTRLKRKLPAKFEPERRSEPENQMHATGSSHSEPNSALHSSSRISSPAASDACMADSLHDLPGMDESFWWEVFSGEDLSATTTTDFFAGDSDSDLQFSNSLCSSDLNTQGDTDFWYNLLNRADQLTMEELADL